jgi:hypothetical protein
MSLPCYAWNVLGMRPVERKSVSVAWVNAQDHVNMVRELDAEIMGLREALRALRSKIVHEGGSTAPAALLVIDRALVGPITQGNIDGKTIAHQRPVR